GEKPLRKIAGSGAIAGEARVFARHRGLGLLLTREASTRITTLRDLVSDRAAIVVATLTEAGARAQYVKTLDSLLGEQQRDQVFSREIDFDARARIQHRDVPFALLTGLADAGLIFSHLAGFYAEAFPDALVQISVPAAEAFGAEIALAQSSRRSTFGRYFEEFLFERAQAAYARGGFAELDDDELGRTWSLTVPRDEG
ncbi:MAG: hypothetical protein AAF658_02395, partial [Myxococcota bacterium]